MAADGGEIETSEELNKQKRVLVTPATNKDCRLLPLPPGGKSRTVEGGANYQVEFPPSTCMDLTPTNSRFACTLAELYKAADLTTMILD